jgi:hypothetical protein
LQSLLSYWLSLMKRGALDIPASDHVGSTLSTRRQPRDRRFREGGFGNTRARDFVVNADMGGTRNYPRTPWSLGDGTSVLRS